MKIHPTLTLALMLAFVSAPFATGACEKHKHTVGQAKPSALPGGSLYHLDSEWTNQKNIKQKLAKLMGRPRLIAMVFTRCQTACPVLIHDLKSIATNIPVDLFSFDSQRETAGSMQDFIKKYNLDERWSVHTSSDSHVAVLAGALGVQYKKLSSGDYIHSNVIFLLNQNGEIVAKKEGLKSEDQAFLDAVTKVSAAP